MYSGTTQFEGLAPVSSPAQEEKARITIEDIDGPAVQVAWSGSEYARPMEDEKSAKKLAEGLTTIRLNQSLLHRMGFRREPGRRVGQRMGRRH